jgi:acyl-CoA thioester hydrolase
MTPTDALSLKDVGSLGIEVWRGCVNPWECDEMGHMNVRFYVAKAMEGLVGLAAALGMPHAFSPFANATLLVREQHIRFLREARPGAPLSMRGAVLEMGEAEARLLLVLFHADGEPAASFQTVVAHIAASDEARPFAWPRRTLDLAAALTRPIPAYAASRSVGLQPFESQASLARADAVGLMTISAGAIQDQHCDVFGRMRVEQFIGRVSDGIAALASASRAVIADLAEARPARTGGAVLEYRLVHLAWPRAGDRFVVRSGMAGLDARTQRLVHWMLDPQTGRPWGVSEAVAVTLDLDARKIVPISEAAQAALRDRVVAGLSL